MIGAPLAGMYTLLAMATAIMHPYKHGTSVTSQGAPRVARLLPIAAASCV